MSRPPRRAAGPRVTNATSFILTGAPLRTATTASSRSDTFFTYPRPRTRYSALFISTVPTPISRLLFCTAFITSMMDTLQARMASGFTSTWYSFAKPPMEATSATPSAVERAYFT